jgi:hypothetical protein
MSPYDLLTVSTWAALGGYEMGTGRTVPTVAAVIGLISVIVAGRALTRRATAGSRRDGAIALVLGSIGAIVGGVHAANAAGGLGTGNGLAGAVAAVALGLIGTILAGLTLARARRHARSGRAA